MVFSDNGSKLHVPKALVSRHSVLCRFMPLRRGRLHGVSGFCFFSSPAFLKLGKLAKLSKQNKRGKTKPQHSSRGPALPTA